MRHPNCRGEGAIRLQRSGTGKRKFRKKQQQQKHTQKETEADYCPSPGKASWEDASPQLLVCAL